MTHSLLESFDPFATHPFTNNSGVIPQPPQPSQYPIPIPSPRRSYYPQFSQSPSGASVSPSSLGTSTSLSSMPSNSPQTSLSVKAPQPQRRVPASPPLPSATQAIFVPFRQETSSPDLVFRKKSPSKGEAAPEPQA